MSFSGKTVHLIGIGGIGMSGIARMLAAAGCRVRGSDARPSEITESLAKAGIDVRIGHDAAHCEGADVVVYSSSILPDHPERAAAMGSGAVVLHRAEALAELCRGKRTIAVAGTHGKTTTTALVGTIFREAGRDPSIVVGGLVISFGGNAYVGRGEEMVIEADESDSSFLKFSPSLEVITNIEREHMDHFGSFEKVRAAFEAFTERMDAGGAWFGCGDDAEVSRLAGVSKRRAVLYGFGETNALRATDVIECPEGRRGVSFRAWEKGRELGRVALKVPGRHNVLNALAALGVALESGIGFEEASGALSKYEGAARRFEVKFEDAQSLIVHDYAHHPTEIRATLAAAKPMAKRRLLAVFQPHRYTRTRDLLKDFAKAFGAADRLIITDVYAAGEPAIHGVSGEAVAAAAREAGHPDAVYVPHSELDAELEAEFRPGDLALVMGAGDVYLCAGRLASKLSGKAVPGGVRADRDVFDLRGRVLRGEPLAKHTTLRVGGPAEYWIEPEDEADLAKALTICRQRSMPFFILGGGSNIVAPDAGFRGAVIHLGSPYFREMRIEPDGTVLARAGVPNGLLIQFAVEQGLGGCEFLSGIPGHIGGAVAMNAGSHGRAVDEIFESAAVLGADGVCRTLARGEMGFRYRSSSLGGGLVLEARFRLPKADPAATRRTLDEYRDYRARTQDLRHASAGCMFKNPSEGGCSSGKLIDDAGMKGRRVGNAQVSTKHANFIVNLGGASAEDVRRLIEEVRTAVRDKFEIDLETEVRIL